MNIFELSGTLRTSLRKGANTLRKQGEIPCVMYGNNVENIHFSVSERSIKDLIYTPHAYVVAITIDGTRRLSILHEIQFHPVTDKVQHLDFLLANESDPITIQIPIVIEGVAEGVKAGGKLIVNTRKLYAKGLIKDLPNSLPVNITDLKLGKTILVADVAFPNIQIVNKKDTIICAVKMTRAALGAAAAASEKK